MQASKWGEMTLTATVAPFLPAPPVKILSMVPSDLNMEYSPQMPPKIVVNWFNEKKYSWNASIILILLNLWLR